MQKIKIFVITGEKSGCDILKNILLELRANYHLEISGIFNEEFEKKFEKSFSIKKVFDLKEISFMGIIDVLLNIKHLLKKINQTVGAIFEEKPDLIISVDSFDFCYRVAKKFVNKFQKNKNHYNFKLPKMIHIVAPSVWLYKQDRAKKLAKFYNLLLTIIPNEERFFTKYNLETHFIGNPALYKQDIDIQEREILLSKLNNFNNKNFTKKDIKIISITIGSRNQEIKKHISIIKETIIKLNEYCKNKNFDFSFKILSTNDTEGIVKSYFSTIDKEIMTKIDIISDEKYKNFIIQNSSFAIAKSGTNTFDFICCKIPMLVYYKTSWINVIIAFFFLRIKFANLLNIIADKLLIPEFLQHKANSKNISNFVIDFFEKKTSFTFEKYNHYIDKFKSPNNSNPFKLGSYYISQSVGGVVKKDQ